MSWKSASLKKKSSSPNDASEDAEDGDGQTQPRNWKEIHFNKIFDNGLVWPPS